MSNQLKALFVGLAIFSAVVVDWSITLTKWIDDTYDEVRVTKAPAAAARGNIGAPVVFWTTTATPAIMCWQPYPATGASYYVTVSSASSGTAISIITSPLPTTVPVQ